MAVPSPAVRVPSVQTSPAVNIPPVRTWQPNEQEEFVKKWSDWTRLKDAENFENAGNDIFQYLFDKLCYVIHTQDDITPAGEEFKLAYAQLELAEDRGEAMGRLFVRGTVLSRGNKDQLLPYSSVDDVERPIIVVPSISEQVPTYCPWLAWRGHRPRYAHRHRIRLWDSSSASTGCPKTADGSGASHSPWLNKSFLL